MKPNRKTRRRAKRLFRLCLAEDGLLDGDRARQVVRRVAAARSRVRLPVLSHFRRLLRLYAARHSAAVQTVKPLPPASDLDLRDRLGRAYGPGLTTSYALDPALIGGMRIKVASDVYDGSVRGRLDALEGRL